MVDTFNFGVPWENSYSFSQAIRAGGLVFVSGQLSHDQRGNFVGEGDFEKQVRQTYANMKLVLGKFDLDLDDIVSKNVYVTDLASQFDTFSKVHKEFFPTGRVTSTIVEVKRFGLHQQLIEISAVAIDGHNVVL